ncbi:MAG: GNAT family N-acetyltransferase [Tardiphaga sp.]
MDMRVASSAANVDGAVIDVERGFDFLSVEYRALFARSDITAFQSPLWQAAIHRDLAPALGAQQHTITVRDGIDGSLLAVLPLVVQKLGPITVMQPADFGVCDANAIVGEDHVLDALANNAVVRRRFAALLKGAGALLYRKVRRDGFDVRRLFDGVTSSVGENAAYHAETGDDFEFWQRKTLNRKFSKELGRLNRQVERDFGPYEHRIAQSEAEIRAAFDFLVRARKDRFKSDLLANPVFVDFYRNYAIAGAATGEAITYVSTLNGEPVAVLFGVAYEQQFHAVLIGVDTERLAKYSLGMQLLYRTIKMRFDAGLHRLDFGLGNTGYKSLFRVDEVLLDNFSVARSPAGALLTAVYHHSKPLKNTLRRFAQRLR